MHHELEDSDISGVIRVVQTVCEAWDDPHSWREQLLLGARTLLGGSAGAMFTSQPTSEGFGRPALLAVVGLAEHLRSSYLEPWLSAFNGRTYAEVSMDVHPGIDGVYRNHMARQGWVTISRREMIDDGTYHSSPSYLKFRQPMGCDDYLASIRIVTTLSRPEAIMVDRPIGAAPFGPREVALMKLLHDEITPLIGIRLATEDHVCRHGLSNRLRQTLTLLTEGLSEKEVARELRLSDRTVHDYVTLLYQHFRVSSRAELLAYFIRRVPLPRPASSVNSAAAIKARVPS